MKFFTSWIVRDDYRGWYYRFAPGLAMPSLATNNGLEGTNKMIKDDYTHRELLGLSRFILVVEQLVKGWSDDPERKVWSWYEFHCYTLLFRSQQKFREFLKIQSVICAKLLRSWEKKDVVFCRSNKMENTYGWFVRVLVPLMSNWCLSGMNWCRTHLLGRG